jgi:(p)ppGpp synthase/HD superfamily hydrolase
MQPLSSRFDQALAVAADLHRQQARKGTSIPYMSHVLAVASIALEYGADEDEAIAALLHDAIEDAPRELGPHAEEIVRGWVAMKFGSRVLQLVEACTDADTRDAHGNKPPWAQRKIDYVASIAQKPASAVLVAAADKLHNARTILRDFRTHRAELWGRFNKEAGKPGVIGYYRGLIIAFRKRLDGLDDNRLIGLIDELDEVVSALEQRANHRGVWPPQPVGR